MNITISIARIIANIMSITVGFLEIFVFPETKLHTGEFWFRNISKKRRKNELMALIKVICKGPSVCRIFVYSGSLGFTSV